MKAEGVAMAPVTSTSMQVTVPQGVQPGQMFMVQAPNGQQVQVQVPQGVMPGMAIQVNLPAPVAAVTPMAIGVPMSMAAPASPQPSYAQVAAPPRSHVPPAKLDGLLLVLAIVVNLAVPIVWWAVLNRDFSITNESRWVTGFRSFAYGALGVPYAFLAVATAVLEIISAAACCPAQKRPSATGGGCSCCGQICLLVSYKRVEPPRHPPVLSPPARLGHVFDSLSCAAADGGRDAACHSDTRFGTLPHRVAPGLSLRLLWVADRRLLRSGCPHGDHSRIRVVSPPSIRQRGPHDDPTAEMNEANEAHRAPCEPHHAWSRALRRCNRTICAAAQTRVWCVGHIGCSPHSTIAAGARSLRTYIVHARCNLVVKTP